MLVEFVQCYSSLNQLLGVRVRASQVWVTPETRIVYLPCAALVIGDIIPGYTYTWCTIGKRYDTAIGYGVHDCGKVRDRPQ